VTTALEEHLYREVRPGRKNTRRHQPARRRHAKHGLPDASESYVGYVSLGKCGGAVIFRSAVERDALTVLELDCGITRIERVDYTDEERLTLTVAQPTKRVSFDLGELGMYTPDLRLTMTTGEVVYAEVGYHKEKVEDAETFRRLQAAAVQAAAEGTGFLILTERVLR
jgi:hypothetical protein